MQDEVFHIDLHTAEALMVDEFAFFCNFPYDLMEVSRVTDDENINSHFLHLTPASDSFIFLHILFPRLGAGTAFKCQKCL